MADMKCLECQTENPDEARFCLRCGASLVLVCAECQTELPTHAAFCFACGAPARVSPADLEEEPGAPQLDSAIQRLVPKEYAQRLLATREDVFKDYTREAFEEVFGQAYEIIRKADINESKRTLYLLRLR